MKKRIKDADLKFCKKVAELSPVKIGFALGVIANFPLLAVLTILGGIGA